MDTPGAGPSSAPALVAGPSAYHESSQFRHWRFSPSGLRKLREELNRKSVEVVARNTALEKEAQISLGHAFTDPPPPSTYLSVEDELLLLHFYVVQASKICRSFGLPETVESTAISYLKRFYLKNSVMEYHPKSIMPTCLFLGAKTTNYPVPIDVFVHKFAKLTPSDVLDTEFLVSQSLSFEFWVRGAEKAVRGWALALQSQPDAKLDAIQKALTAALEHLGRSRQTDAEFIYTPSQLGLACFHTADSGLVEGWLDWKYGTYEPDEDNGDEDGAGAAEELYGVSKERLLEIVAAMEKMIGEVEDVDLKKVKDVDKRLRGCTNPEKVPGTALYIKRKQALEATESALRAAKSQKLAAALSSTEMVFGDVINPSSLGTRKPLSPMSTIPPATMSPKYTLVSSPMRKMEVGGPGTGEGDGAMENGGLGLPAEGMGYAVGGRGLKDVGKGLDDDD